MKPQTPNYLDKTFQVKLTELIRSVKDKIGAGDLPLYVGSLKYKTYDIGYEKFAGLEVDDKFVLTHIQKESVSICEYLEANTKIIHLKSNPSFICRLIAVYISTDLFDISLNRFANPNEPQLGDLLFLISHTKMGLDETKQYLNTENYELMSLFEFNLVVPDEVLIDLFAHLVY
jgi:hypothetical protein